MAHPKYQKVHFSRKVVKMWVFRRFWKKFSVPYNQKERFWVQRPKQVSFPRPKTGLSQDENLRFLLQNCRKVIFSRFENLAPTQLSVKKISLKVLLEQIFFKPERVSLVRPPPDSEKISDLEGGGSLSSVISVVPLERFLTFSENLKDRGGAH